FFSSRRRHTISTRDWSSDVCSSDLDLFGKTLLILGVGATGGYLARLAQIGLGMRILGLARTRRDHPHVDRYITPHELHQALGERSEERRVGKGGEAAGAR